LTLEEKLFFLQFENIQDYLLYKKSEMNYLSKKIIKPIRFIGLFVLFICLTSMSAYAQEVISGKITDESGEALIGVTVSVQGTSLGTATDIDGNFTIEAASDAVLEISYVGYQAQTIPVNGQASFNVTLAVDAEVLDEVVVCKS